MKAIDIMTTPVFSVRPDMTVTDIARLLLERHISAVPVIDAEGRLVGIVSEGDLMRRAEIGTEKRHSWWLTLFLDSAQLAAEYIKTHGLKAGDVMTTPVVTVTPDTTLAGIADVLERNRIKRVPVVRDGKAIGIVSRANLLQAFAAARLEATAPAAQDDRDIRDRILSELAAQPWADLATANVIVKDGVVELWGFVPTEIEREALRVAVERIPGVRRIESHLALRPPAAYGV